MKCYEKQCVMRFTYGISTVINKIIIIKNTVFPCVQAQALKPNEPGISTRSFCVF